MILTCSFLSQREKVVATLEGHNGNVTCAEFCPHYTLTLVSISEDRTYKVGGSVKRFGLLPNCVLYVNLDYIFVSMLVVQLYMANVFSAGHL